MACVALTSKPTHVGVVTPMARYALAVSVMKRRRSVALVTGDMGVCADQWKARNVVIK